MPNNLTGDFDVVAEFSIPAANRVLAAMHRSERFLHSISVRVDDDPPPGPVVPPVVVGAVDSFGDAIVNHSRIGTPNPFPGDHAATDVAYSVLGTLLNPDVAGATDGPIVPSHLKGRAQLQLFPPTLEVAGATGSKLTVRMNLLSRYFPDSNTSPLAEFIRGELQVTADVNQVASQTANVVDINFKADTAYINFTPAWSSQPLSPENLAGINLMIKNALKTSFLPSNVTLPSDIEFMQFKTLLSPQSAVAVLLNLSGPRGNPASMNNVFLGAGDDFALSAGADFVRAAFQPALDAILVQPSFNVTIPIDVYLTTYHVVYAITLQGASVDLQNGKIVITITGKAAELSHKWYAPDNFDFTAKLSFTLQADGGTANLVPGDVSLDTSSWLVNVFRGSAAGGIRQVRDQALDQSGAYATVRDTFDVNKSLGGFLNSLLPPPRRRFIFQPRAVALNYTSVEIRPAGIVLHGSLAVPEWPPAFVEFEQVPPNTAPGPHGHVLPRLPDYSALKSWIPGGTIQRYEWSHQGQPQPFLIDQNKFVLVGGPQVPTSVSDGLVSAYSPLCLTVRGTRLSASGPVITQQVSATVCGYNSVSVIPGGLVASVGGALPMLALTHAGAEGQIAIAGHTPAAPDTTGRGTPNLIVHFPDDASAGQLEVLPRALGSSGRKNTPTAVLAPLTPDQLSKSRYTPGVIYGDNRDGAWERVFGAKNARRPLTLIVTPEGKIVWQNEGELNHELLATALRTHLVTCGAGWMGMFRPDVRIGQPAPDFLFEYAPGYQLTLRKLAPATIVFWKASSTPSIEAARDLQAATRSRKSALLAINDGDTPDLAKQIAEEHGFAANLVADPRREISLGYGVELWPTIILVDEAGAITGVRTGHHPGEQADITVKQTAA